MLSERRTNNEHVSFRKTRSYFDPFQTVVRTSHQDSLFRHTGRSRGNVPHIKLCRLSLMTTVWSTVPHRSSRIGCWDCEDERRCVPSNCRQDYTVTLRHIPKECRRRLGDCWFCGNVYAPAGVVFCFAIVSLVWWRTVLTVLTERFNRYMYCWCVWCLIIWPSVMLTARSNLAMWQCYSSC